MNVHPYADLDGVVARARAAWRPPPRLTLSEWAEREFYLSAESAATPGRWKTIPYQRGIMDAITDPRVTHVSVMKSARVGYTKIVNAAIGYHMQHAPCPILVVQPTVDDAKGYSKEEIAPMLRDCPSLAKIVFEDSEDAGGPREGGNTILHKRFPGGVLSMVGANSGAGFRRISRKVVVFDEVDAYPASAGSDGDPIRLGTKRSEFYHDRKIIAGSTPLIAGHSRIEELFHQGDERRFYVPCPSCGHFDYFGFTERESGEGHWMQFDPKAPEDAHFVCSKNGCVIEHKHKRDMVTRGEWRATKPFNGHASFHIWAAYSFSPNATWADLAREFLEAKAGGVEQLKTFINTALGETWQERGEAPDWQRLFLRREQYEIGTVPDGVKFLTAGVDVQKDRWVYEVVGWGADRESWSIDSGVVPGNTADENMWSRLDELLARTYYDAAGVAYVVGMLAVDSGYNTQIVYSWGRRYPLSRVMAVKGSATQRALVGAPSPVDVTISGRKMRGGYKVWPIGVAVAKSEIYGYLRIDPPTADGAEYAPGFCHFPQYGEDYFKQLTAEHLVSTTNKRTGFTVQEWQLIPGRENHQLDARVYARAAAGVLGLDRIPRTRARPVVAPAAPAAPAQPVAAPAPAPPRPKRQIPDSHFLSGRGRRGSWL